MRSALILLFVVLSGCAASTPQPPAEPPAVPPQAAAAACIPAPVAAVATPAAVATKAYRQAEASEGHAVTKPTATADYIKEIHAADLLARRALRALVAQDGHPTPAAIAEAKRSMDALVTALEATPQGTSP